MTEQAEFAVAAEPITRKDILLDTGSRPVAGGPRALGAVTFVYLGIGIPGVRFGCNGVCIREGKWWCQISMCDSGIM